MAIKYLKHNEIDKTKWDYCVEHSINSLVYGMSWYLDNVCENWDALVTDDYEAVMPLPWKRKFGLKYIYHPYFAQQLGIFYTKNATINASDFINAIPVLFLKYELSLNSSNYDKDLIQKRCNNYLLSLNKPYPDILKCYDTKCRRNIKLSKQEPVTDATNLSVDTLIKLKEQDSTFRLSDTHTHRLRQLLNYLLTTDKLCIIGVYDTHKTLLGAAAFVYFKNRIIYLFSVSSHDGKKKRVMYRILNSVIEEHAGNELILDFEGSMLESVAVFFRGFGGTIEIYYRMNKSKIPFIK